MPGDLAFDGKQVAVANAASMDTDQQLFWTGLWHVPLDALQLAPPWVTAIAIIFGLALFPTVSEIGYHSGIGSEPKTIRRPQCLSAWLIAHT